jgi:hypothetical protein
MAKNLTVTFWIMTPFTANISDIFNVYTNQHEVPGRTNHILFFDKHGQHMKRSAQQFFFYKYYVSGHYPSSYFI